MLQNLLAAVPSLVVGVAFLTLLWALLRNKPGDRPYGRNSNDSAEKRP